MRLAALLGIAALAVGCGGGRTLEARMDHAEDQGRRAEALLDEAEQRMDALDAERAEAALAEAKERLADPDIAKYPEHGLLRDRHKAGEARLVEVKAEIARLELERAVLAQRQLLETAAARLEKALEGARRPDAATAQLGELEDGAGDLTDKLANGTELEVKDKPLQDYAANVRKLLDKAKSERVRLERVIAFREGPAVALEEGVALVDQAKAETDDAKRRELEVEALDRFRTCATSGRGMLEANAELAKLKIELGGKTTTPDAVAGACEKQRAAIEKKITAKKAPPKAKAKPKKKKKKKGR